MSGTPHAQLRAADRLGFAVLVFLGGGLVWIGDASHPVRWFAWDDLLIVSLLAAAPFGWWGAATLRAWLGRITIGLIAITLLVAAVGAVAVIPEPSHLPTVWSVEFVRWVVALWVTISAAGLLHVCRPGPASGECLSSFVKLSAALAVSWFIPQVYAEAHFQHDQQQLTELVEQDRLGEAVERAEKLLAARPHGHWRGIPWQTVVTDLRRAVARLEKQVQEPLSAEASLAERLDRARRLGMLGRGDEAVEWLSTAAETSADAALILATSFEHRRDWTTARSWYRCVVRQLDALPADRKQRQDLAQAWAGIGYCERKLGNLPNEEAAYQQALTLMPDAESHFLLAQFYEDTQRAEQAHQHARRARQLDPLHFAEPARRLTDQLLTRHFGCFSVYRAEP